MLKNDGNGHDGPKLWNILSQRQINSVLYSDPFLKAGFLAKLVSETETNILYIDLDLLYSGYITAEILSSKKNLAIYRPTKTTLNVVLTEVLAKASASQALIILDSINGFFNMLNYKKQVGKAVTSIVMLLASIARTSNSSLVISSMARYKKEEGWVLSPTGRRLIETKNSKQILLEHAREGILINTLDKSGKILLPSHSIPL